MPDIKEWVVYGVAKKKKKQKRKKKKNLIRIAAASTLSSPQPRIKVITM